MPVRIVVVLPVFLLVKLCRPVYVLAWFDSSLVSLVYIVIRVQSCSALL